MLFKRAREFVSDIYHNLIQGTVRDVAKCNKILKAIDDNNVNDLRTILEQLIAKDIEDYLRQPVDSMRRTPLHFAAWAENADLLEILLDYVTEPDVEDKTGATPMMFVVGSGQNCLKKMQLFISKHANVNRRDKSGWTLLHAAVQSKKRGRFIFYLVSKAIDRVCVCVCVCSSFIFVDILELLIDNGANIHLVDGENRSLLHIACDNGDLALVKYLIDKGVSLKIQDKNGWTPLHIACGPADDYELVHYLIQNGANPWACDVNQHTPLDLASQFQAKKVEFYLKTFNQCSSESDRDDISSDLGIANDTYESDNVFESEPTSNRVSQRSTRSIRLLELTFNRDITNKV
jgi:ankyrin repeat protein